MPVFHKIEGFISNIKIEIINDDRKEILKPLVNFIQQKVNRQDEIRLNFICTHNSRRSHLAQVWAQTLAYYFGIEKVFCYSGGEEITALYPMIAETLRNAGFQINKLSEGQNPVYRIKYAENEYPIIGFSKNWNDEFNPKSKFAAIMTCSQADENCPFIAGAEKRMLISFEDPQKFDGTSQQSEQYNKSSMQIAAELFYVFSKIELKQGP